MSNDKIWNMITKSFAKNPRDIITKPLNNKSGVWYNVKCTNGKIYVSSGNKEPRSNISKERELNKIELDEILSWYRKRGTEEYDSKKVNDFTLNSSYWYGIFCDLKIK